MVQDMEFNYAQLRGLLLNTLAIFATFLNFWVLGQLPYMNV